MNSAIVLISPDKLLPTRKSRIMPHTEQNIFEKNDLYYVLKITI